MFTGYQFLEELHLSAKTRVFRALCLADQSIVVIKTLSDPYASSIAVAKLKREIALLKSLKIKGVIQVRDSIFQSHLPALIMEDLGVLSLHKERPERFSLDDFFEVALPLVQTLGKLHAQGILHKDLNPRNIIYNFETKELRLIDFEISSELSYDVVSGDRNYGIEGTLAYIAPEQTGRVNRDIDYRSDMYSLGATFYEWLTGKLPFEAKTTIGWVYQHIAKQPADPCEHEPSIPAVLGEIVLKLLAKDPDDRYQSTGGLLFDLETCKRMLEEGKEPVFSIAKEDVPEHFCISKKLHGREREMKLLMDAYEAILEQETKAILIEGDSGLGKSALIREFHTYVTQQHGLFISGKFQQFQDDGTQSALGRALDQLADKLLMLPSNELEIKKELLSNALGDHAAIIVDFAPEFGKILSHVDMLPTLLQEEQQTRFTSSFVTLFRLLASKEQPLVIYLDNLQWADQHSLNLLKELFLEPEIPHLMLLLSYRERETCPLNFLESLEGRTHFEHILLKPLTQEQVAALIADSLFCKPAEIGVLAELIHGKTVGNPFFVHALLRRIFEEGGFWFNDETCRWQWCMDMIRKLEVSDNVVDLIIDEISLLPEDSRHLLAVAACIGSPFSLSLLGTSICWDTAKVVQALWPVLKANLITPLDPGYKWLLQESEKNEEAREISFCFHHDRILAVVKEIMDRESWLIDSPEEKIHIAELNSDAAQRASVPQLAAAFCRQGIRFLPEDSWQTHYALTLNLYQTYAQAICGDASDSEIDQVFAILEKNVTDETDRAENYLLQMSRLLSLGAFEQILKITLKVAKLLGFHIPLHPKLIELQQQEESVAKLLKVTDLSKLAQREEIKERRLILLSKALYQMDSILFLLPKYKKLKDYSLLLSMELYLRNGNTQFSGSSFALYAEYLIRKNQFENVETLGAQAVLLTKQQEGGADCYILMLVAGFVSHRVTSFRETVPLFQEIYERGMACGERHMGLNGAIGGIELNPDLPLQEKVEKQSCLDDLFSADLMVAQPYHLLLQQCRKNLMGKTHHIYQLTDDFYDEEKALPAITANKPVHLYYCYYKALIHFLYNDYKNAAKYSAKAEKLRACQAGIPIEFDDTFISFLIHARLCPDEKGVKRRRYLAKLKKSLVFAQSWALPCPVNYGPQFWLMKAEYARLRGRYLEAEDLYEKAVDSAANSGDLRIEAIASEVTGLFYQMRNLDRIAHTYFHNALYAYDQWGAERKVELMEKERQDLVRRPSGGYYLDSISHTGETSSIHENLNLSDIIAGSRAIAAENKLDGLLTQVMKTALENAGAVNGYLILKRNEQFVVKAQGYLVKTTHVELLSALLGDFETASHGVVYYVARTGESVLLHDATQSEMFNNDPYIEKQRCKSILCVPLLNQGQIIAIVYMENQKVSGAFNEDHLEVLKLLMTPAAVSIENALLKEDESLAAFKYQVGGSLSMDATTYVVRQADRDLQDGLRNNAFCYVLTCRQMGKSSLRVHTMKKLLDEGVHCVSIDITMIGSNRTTIDQWYAGIARVLIQKLGLRNQINLRTWWREHAYLSPVNILGELFELILDSLTGEIVIFIDEIDSVLSLDFCVDDFFAMIRALFNRRADEPKFHRLSFALFGVASPTELIRDKTRTPFNIGHSIVLDGFQFREAKPLIIGLADKSDDPEHMMKVILSWTGGQPFLTQKVCHMLRQLETKPQGRLADWVAREIRRNLVDFWERNDEPEHFRTIRDRIYHDPAGHFLLLLYRKVLETDVLYDDSQLQTKLILSGLVKNEQGHLKIANRIYAQIFTKAWVERSLTLLSSH